MSKWLKVTFFVLLLVGAGYFFGTVCRQIGQAYRLILFPSGELLNLLLWFLLALGAVAVIAGLVAGLLRPLWVGIIAFALSGLAMLLGWQMTLGSGILILVYLLAASLYTVSVARELDERIRFSVRPISEGQGMFLIALILAACGSLYLGCAAHIEREGFSIPEFYIEMFMKPMEKQIEAQGPAGERQEALARFRKEFRRAVDEFFKRTVKPYEQFIPLAVAASLFMPLVTISRLLAWVPTMFLSIVFHLLKALGVIKVVSETREGQTLVIG
jgi:MFS family permease